MKTMYIRYDGWSPSVLGDAVSGQVNTLRCSFAFSADWDAYKNRKAIFETDEAKKEESLDENGVCLIPRAVLMKRGKLKISAYGTETGENGELLRYNGRPAEIIVDLGGNVDGEITDDPVYPQIGEAVLYTAQSLTDAQKAQARANIGAGTPYTLPEASSDALGGIKADAAETADTQPVRIGGDGKLYTAPGVQEIFTVKISKDSDGNITAEKTFAEIKEANDAGMLIFAVYESTIYSLAGYEPNGIASFERNSGSSYMGFTCESFEGEDYWNYYEESLTSLGIFGATAGQIPVISEVDEYGYPTRWASANMPSGGGADISLGISGATAGQMAKVKAVDASGAPTAWEAGDAASGGSEWIKLGDVTVNQTAEFVPLSFESGIVTIDTNADGYASLPSSGTIGCIVHTIDVTSKANPVVGMLKPKNYEAGTFEFYNRDSVFQSSAAYDPTTYKISIGNVAMVVLENIPTDYKRYKSRVTTPAYTNHGLRARYTCDGFTEIGCGADSTVNMVGGAIIETEFYPHPYDENYVYRRVRTAYGKFYGGGSGNEFQSFELISSGSGKTKPQESGKISFRVSSMIFVNGTRFELWGTNDD